MSVILLPRLKSYAVDDILSSIGDIGERLVFKNNSFDLPEQVVFAPVGGSRIGRSGLEEIRSQILQIAAKSGFPGPASSKQKSSFDINTTKWLAETGYFKSGEALRDDVWAFIATWLLGDLTAWRFDNTATARFHGGVRNAFQRLYLRSLALDRGADASDRWFLVEQLTEDAVMQLVERPSVSSQPILARMIAEGWVRASAIYQASDMEGIMRKTVIGLRLLSEVRDLCALDEYELNCLIDNEFERSAVILGAKKKTSLFKSVGRKSFLGVWSS